MRRLPVLGTAVLFVAMMGGAAQVSADPITIEAGTHMQGVSKPALVSLSGSGFYFEGRGHDVDAPELGEFHSAEARFDDLDKDNSRLSRVSFNGAGYGNLWVGGTSSVTSASFTPSASSGNAAAPFQFTANLGGSGSVSEAANASGVANASVVAQVAGSNGLGRAAFVQSGQPSSIAANFGNASSVVTPEPASMLLLGSGLAFAGLGRLRRRKARA